MNDYKKLIVKCEEWLAITKRLKTDGLTQHIEMCADAIERLSADNETYKCAFADLHNEIANYCETIATLEKERDAAVAELKGHCRCSDCKHLDANNRCKENHSCFDVNHWEWRGVREDNDENTQW